MSLYAINNYYKNLEKVIKYGGSKNETSIKHAFYNLLNEYAIQKDLFVAEEIHIKTTKGNLIRVDGVVKDSLQNDWGYWESKDEFDDIKEEVKSKFKKGYPNDNIIFEDTKTAILYQSGAKVMQVDMQDEIALDKILAKFLSYERPEIKTFREAIEKFKEDIPKVADSIKQIIDGQQKTNKALIKAENQFLELCRTSINEAITKQDVIEMMVQHILSADIFNTIFDEPHFHQENNVARELNKVLETFFTGVIRRQTLGNIKHYYDTINARAAQIADHHEKQKFLKVVYENFYKGYNPKAADKLGIVYTPNEIVRFMIESTDSLLHRHFSKTLSDKGVDIFDPATGTGTFICDLIDHIHPKKLKDKYKNELHANEVSILPYYIANLNIEYTYKQKMGNYEEFENLCFADTLDKSSQHLVQAGLFSVSAENTTRIRKQNERKISVIIGNPPYNANQQNENDNNKNRVYDKVDERIKDTFIKNSTAQKTKMYDMYSRFYRWAMDRLNDNGIIAFVTNRSFIDSKTFDGFRKTIQDDFDFTYIIDTKSDVRANPKIAGTTHNVFGIQAGVAVMFLVKTSHKKIKHTPCKIEYVTMEDNWLKQEKLNWFSEHKFDKIDFDNITPDKNNNWLNITDNDWDLLVPICSKDVKSGESNQAIFELFSLGVVTSRDDWSYDFNKENLEKKVKFFCNFYNKELERWGKSNKKEAPNDFVDRTIKFGDELVSHLIKGDALRFDKEKLRDVMYRPYIKKNGYIDKIISHRLYQLPSVVGINKKHINPYISFTFHPQLKYPSILSSNCLWDYAFGGRDSTGLCLYKYDVKGVKTDNITDWALHFFQKNYSNKKITKQDIFYYVYAVLHDKFYLKTYEINLKRELPRIPLNDNFNKWVNWGKELMNLHIEYETATPYKLQIINKKIDEKFGIKTTLKANKETGVITLDEKTEITGIPKQAWEYQLGSRSALEWILDQYKEKKPTDATIADKFNTYKFADYKDHVIDLIKRVCTVSVRTVEITKEMSKI